MPTTEKGYDWGAFLESDPLDENPPLSPSAFGKQLLAVDDATGALTLLGISALTIPDPTGQSGNFLTTDGVSLSWSPAAGGGGTWGTIVGTLSDQSDLNTALGNKQPLDSDLTAIAALTTTSYGRGFLPLADAAAARTYIGAGTSSFDGAFSSLSGKPTTIAGYGITDFNSLGDARWSLLAHTHTFASLTSKPTTLSGYGITDAQPLDSDLTSIAALTTTSFGRSLLAQADAAATRSTIGAGTSSFSGLFTGLDFTSSNLTSIATRNFSDLQNIPTTVAGYGITDFNSLGDARWSLLEHTHTFASLTSKPTTAVGFGITGGANLDALAGLTSAADKLPYFTGSGTAAVTTLSSFARTILDDADAPTVRSTIGVGNVLNPSRQTFSNANVTVTAGTTTLAQTGTMSATRTVTLPAASSYANGTGFTLIDESGTMTPAGLKYFSVVRAGSDTLNGGTSAVMVIEPIAYFQSDGVSKWVVNTDGDHFVDSLGRAHFKSLSIGSNPGTIEAVGNLDFFGTDGTSGFVAEFSGGNNDDNNIHIKGINSIAIATPFMVNGRGKIVLGDDNDVVNGYELQITLPTFSATRFQSWANGDGTIALTGNTSGVVDVAHGGTNSTTASDARTVLGLAIGTNVQAYDADLTTWAGITPGTNVATFLATPSSANLRSALTDENGTGAALFDGSTSQALTTPKITTGILDANGNSMLAFTATASAVDGFTFTNAATANPAAVKIAATGTDTNIHFQVAPKGSGDFQTTVGAIQSFNGYFKSPAATNINIYAGANIVLNPGGSGTVQATTAAFFGPVSNNAIDSGDSTHAWRDLFVARNATFGGPIIATPQALSGAGAVNVTTSATAFTSTGAAQALTLADGTNGQIKSIAHVSDGGSGVLTPTTKSGYSTITFANVGDAVTLQFFSTAGWIIIGQNGVTVAP